jgi:hypothetical protein
MEDAPGRRSFERPISHRDGHLLQRSGYSCGPRHLAARTVDVLLFRDQSAGRLLGDIAHLTALATGEIERDGEQRGDLVPREGTSGSAASARAKGLTTAPPRSRIGDARPQGHLHESGERRRTHAPPDTPGQSAKRRPVMRSYAVT